MSQAGEIDVIGNNPQIPTQFDGDTGSAVPIGNLLNIVGTGGIATSASGNTVTIDGSGIVGGVQTVSGTTDRITSTGGANPVIDIAGTYVGQTSITTLGTITTGVWNGTTVGPTFGGTGQTTYTTGDILYASAANTLSKRTIGATNNLLTVTGGVPVWTATPSVTSITLSGGTALSNYTEGSFTPTLVGQTTAGTTTYSVRTGFYRRIGSLVSFNINITLSSATGTGDVLIGGLPFTINSNWIPVATVYISSTWAWPANRTFLVFTGSAANVTGTIRGLGSSLSASSLQMTNANLSVIINGQYIV